MSAAAAHKTILIANPCDAERVLLRHALESNGFEVMEADCAKEAVGCAMSRPTDVVLLDTLGWDNPSLATLTVLKHHANTCRLPVVIFGQPQSKEQVAEAVRKGAATWIGRQGFNLARFVERINQVSLQTQPALAAAGTGTEAAAPRLARITLNTIDDAVAEAGLMPAFEFSLMQAMTTTAGKDQACDHIAGIVGRDPCLTLALLSKVDHTTGTSLNEAADTRQAVAHFGPQAFYRMIESVPSLKLNLSSLWDAGCWWAHSVATSRISELLSRKVGLGVPAVVANAGLLQDLGLLFLATHLPKYYGLLVTAGSQADTVHPMWEKDLVGVHHGEIAASIMRSRGLPSLLSEAALIHHATGTMGQVSTASSRLVGMIVQAAGALADALLPADPPLASVTSVSDEFEAVLRQTNLPVPALVDTCRKLLAEIITELGYLFPQSTTRSYFHKHEPLKQVAYFSHGETVIDVVKLFFEVRSGELLTVDRRSLRSLPASIPMVVNLTRVEDPAAQVEILTSLMADRVFDDRTGVVLLPAAVSDRLAQNVVPTTWRLVCKPAHSWRLVRFLAGGATGEGADALCVA